MNNAVASIKLSWDAQVLPSLDSCDDDEWVDGQRYCPTRLLSAFTLLMAGHGRSVRSSMMLGDREYAMWQLARAHTMGDPKLREISAKLFAYFDDERAPVPVGLRA